MENHTSVTITTDYLVDGVYERLCDDLKEHLAFDPPTLETLREFDWRPPVHAHHYRVKAWAQIAGWKKRFIGEHDPFADIDLEIMTDDKFIADQIRIGSKFDVSARTAYILQLVRKEVRRVLGRFREEDILPFCMFSKNSTVGFHGDSVYLDVKLAPGSELTGTASEVSWFKDHVKDDPILNRLKLRYRLVTSLDQINVPKSWKIKRPVRPNTLIGTYRSLGLGGLIRQRLKEDGINLNYLQPKHGYYAKEASRHLRLVTADLSAASDSFTVQLVNRVIPRDWFNALKFGRTPYVTLEDNSRGKAPILWSPSFMAMGIGYTFPLMTLIFLCLLRVLRDLSKGGGKVSVFGDDLIYPTRLHHAVKATLSDMGFELNDDKTFIKEPFRESCGYDFYDGFDVRPACPEGVSELLKGRLSIASYVYKLYNSLIRRWEEVELPTVFRFLKDTVVLLLDRPHHVPDHFPDESGFKDGRWKEFIVSELPLADNLGCWRIGDVPKNSTNKRVPWCQRQYVLCLGLAAKFRPVGSMDIYLWKKLNKQVEVDVEPIFSKDIRVISDNLTWTRASHDLLVWRRVKKKDCTGKKGSKREWAAFTTRRGSLAVKVALIDVMPG